MEKEILEDQVSRGLKAKAAYEGFIKEFVEKKRQALIQDFISLDTSDSAGILNLMENRKLYSLLQDIEKEIESIILSGELAKITLKK